MSKIVPSYGPKSAKICIVGEAPGVNEEQTGRPFVGAAGGLLRVMLADSGINMDSCRLLNVMQIRPPGNRFEHFYHDSKKRFDPKGELIIGRQRLEAELRLLNPNVIIALGNEPLVALTGKRGIDKWRGTIFQTEFGKVIPTYHPAYILRNYSDRPIAQVDLTRCCLESTSPSFEKPKLNIEVRPSFSRVMEYLSSSPKIVTFDTETLGRHVRCVGIADSTSHAICIPLIRVNQTHKSTKISLTFTPQDSNPSYWDPREERAILEALSKFFANPKIKFVAQNYAFDSTVMEDNFKIRAHNFYLDTMHAHHLMYPELPMSLDFLTSVYTKIGYYADYDSRNDESTWVYNGHDCIATFQCIDPILRELEALGMRDFYFNQTHLVVDAFSFIQNRGVLIDVKNRKKLAEPLEVEIEAFRQKFKTKYKIDVRKQVSPKQIKEVMTEVLHIPIPERQGKETTDRRALDSLIASHPDIEFFKDILDQREKVKFYGTYVTAQLDEDGRMRTSYNVSGTITGRLSSSKNLWGTGGNLQNIPKSEFRRLFIVPEGFTFIHVDLSQAETRVVAWLTRDLLLMDRFANDPTFDVHRFNASRLFNVPENKVTPIQRQRGKNCNHSGNYGISWKKFAYIAKIPYGEAKDLLYKHQNNPYLKAWWDRVRLQLRTNRTLITPKPFERKRLFFGRLDDETFRQAYNFVPQSIVGDVINEACWKLEAILDPEIAAIILQVHDEIDFEVRDDKVDEVIGLIRNALNIPLDFGNGLPTLTIPLDVSIGSNWYDLKEYSK